MLSKKQRVAFARRLAQTVSQEALQQAISVAYYAMFHDLSENTANLLIGSAESPLGKQAWLRAYRSLDHRQIRKVCANDAIMQQFPLEIREFAETFVEMQSKRHAANYDPHAHFEQVDVLDDIDNVEKVIQDFNAASAKDRQAFIAFILFKPRDS